jgi:hypothetical protein
VSDAIDVSEPGTQPQLELHAVLRTAMLAIARDNDERVNAWRLGNFIAQHEDRIEQGLRFVRAGKSHGAVLWQVETLSQLHSREVEI